MSWSGETADAGDLKSLGAIRTGSNPVFSMRGSSVAAGFFLCPEGMDASIPAQLYEGDGLERRPAVRRLAGRASRAANEHGCLTEKIDGCPRKIGGVLDRLALRGVLPFRVRETPAE